MKEKKIISPGLITLKKSVPKYKTLTEYAKHNIIEVDLNYCYNLIESKKELWIVDKDNTLTKKERNG